MFAESDPRSRSTYFIGNAATTLPSTRAATTLRAAAELELHASKKRKHRQAIASLLLSRGSDSDSPARDDLSKSPARSQSPDSALSQRRPVAARRATRPAPDFEFEERIRCRQEQPKFEYVSEEVTQAMSDFEYEAYTDRLATHESQSRQKKPKVEFGALSKVRPSTPIPGARRPRNRGRSKPVFSLTVSPLNGDKTVAQCYS